VLDVLELDAGRAPHEDRVRVRRVDDVGDFETALLRFPDVVVRGLDAEAEMVEQRTLGLRGRALLEVDVGVARFEPAVLHVEAELAQLLERLLGVGNGEGDVVEVVRHAVFHLDEGEGDALGARELDAAVLAALDGEVRGQLVESLVEIEDAQPDPCERPGLTLGLGREERQLSAARIRTHEGELVGPVDDVHAEAVGEEVGQLVPVADPERNVVKGLDFHRRNVTPLPRLPTPRTKENSRPAAVKRRLNPHRIGLPIPRRASMLTFGVTVLPDPPHARFVELMKLAEDNGFEYGWTYDSHILWQDAYPLMTLLAVHTERLKMGHCVTNPGTREPTVTASAYATLHDISDGRMVMGIGRGDSARRVIGYKPVKMAEFEAALAMMKDLMNGRPVEWNGKELELTWAQGRPEIPLYVAAYGPRALGVAGRVGDGVIIQLADPVIIEWIMEQARAAATEAGRDPDELQCLVCAPSIITDDMQEARDAVRWFPAMVSNHVMDLIERYGENSEIPSELTDYVKARKFYDYKDHSREGAAHGEFVTDEICDRFSVIGSVDQVTAKLKELESIGVDHYNIYLMTHGQEEILRSYGAEIIPQFKGAAV
jgi:probable F420-dependent oxidoreductase